MERAATGDLDAARLARDKPQVVAATAFSRDDDQARQP